MKVYLLVRDDWPEGGTVLGVYSTQEKAQEAWDDTANSRSNYYCIEEWEVDYTFEGMFPEPKVVRKS